MQDAGWARVLWQSQDFPDNHVPSAFLAQLKNTASFPRYRLRDLISASLPVTQHFLLVFLFVTAFHHLLEGGSTILVTRDLPAAFTLFVCSWTAGPGLITAPNSKLPFLLLPLLLALLSPMIGTLTSATTSDTIWPLASTLLFVHIVLAVPSAGTSRPTYGKKHSRGHSDCISGAQTGLPEIRHSLASSLSLTCSLSAGIVLSSRLLSVTRVFSLMVLSAALFGGWPSVSKRMNTRKRWITLVIFSFAYVYSRHSPSGPRPSWPYGLTAVQLILSMIVMATSLLGPSLLWGGWRWKTRMGGEWNAAVVKLRRRRQSD